MELDKNIPKVCGDIGICNSYDVVNGKCLLNEKYCDGCYSDKNINDLINEE